MRKKLTALLLALALTTAAGGCGSADGAASSTGASSSAATQSGESSAETGAGSSSSATGESEEAAGDAELPAESQPGQQTSAQDKPAGGASAGTGKPLGSTSKPSAGTGKPSADSSAGSSSGSSQSGSVDLSAFYTSLTSDSNFPSMSKLTGDGLDSFYAGLSDLAPKQCLVYTPMISAAACEVALVECASGSDVQTVKDIFQSRIDYQIEQGAFYPATVEAWQSSAKIVSNGNYVLLVCYEDADTVIASFNALFK